MNAFKNCVTIFGINPDDTQLHLLNTFYGLCELNSTVMEKNLQIEIMSWCNNMEMYLMTG